MELKYYKLNDDYLFSYYDIDNLEKIPESEAKNSEGIIYFISKFNPINSRRGFCLSSPQHMFIKEEGIDLLRLGYSDINVPCWVEERINKNEIKSINIMYPYWKKELVKWPNKKWKLNLLALGDVGSTLLIGLVLLGGDVISEIGIYDRNIDRLKRWEYELNQIKRPFDELAFPKVVTLSYDELFDCDMFIFCASKGIPPVGSEVSDVRMAQYESNKEIVAEYARLARTMNFNGIFAVVSDPVDLLCKVTFLESNKNDTGEYDFNGLGANQIIGYGLGVMNARAAFYAEKSEETKHYLKEGRVFGPHGDGLIVADSIKNYSEELSNYLTEKAINANKEIRAFGFKPFIAPSLSSGALSIIATIKGDYFYGSTYMGNAYMGSKCRLTQSGIQVESLNLPENLYKKIKLSYERLVSII